MNELDALLAGIVSDPTEETRWLVLADWLEEHDDPRRGELLRLHRRLLATSCEPDKHPERATWQPRIVELIDQGVRPCVPQRTVTLPGGVPMTFSFIPPGQFLMGSDHEDGQPNEQPVHKVTLTKGFLMGIHPVTQAQWLAIMKYDPSDWMCLGPSPSVAEWPNRPIVDVSWDECQEFCEGLAATCNGRLKPRLPTEAEWECACRAGTTTEYHFGDVIDTDLANYRPDLAVNYLEIGEIRNVLTDVGSFPANAWGLFDVHGNVFEWCGDWYGPYSAEDQVNPLRKDAYLHEGRVLRGGAWDTGPEPCRAAFRRGDAPSNRIQGGHGFRVALHLD